MVNTAYAQETETLNKKTDNIPDRYVGSVYLLTRPSNVDDNSAQSECKQIVYPLSHRSGFLTVHYGDLAGI
jgi:hypothetical protein